VSTTQATRARLERIHPLLREDGAVFAEIDDNELGTLITLMDKVFGRENRISTITIVRSAPTGHKAINPGPVHVSDFLLAYAKDKKKWKYRPQVKVREEYYDAYGTWLENPDSAPAKWRFRPLKAVVATSLAVSVCSRVSRWKSV
jgi:adenine-specific DNA-methyltransferase